jgi:catechol 2,3-dioxygenase-like lactoylglutathione lyase family enzyme
MYTHVMVGTNDPAKALPFYDACFAALGRPCAAKMEDRAFYGTQENGMFGVGPPRDGEPATYANGGTIGFTAPDKDAVDAWYKAGMELGGSDEGAPAEREWDGMRLYGGYMRDPDGNKLCAYAILGKVEG